MGPMGKDGSKWVQNLHVVRGVRDKYQVWVHTQVWYENAVFCGTRRGQCSSTLATVIRAFCMELRGANNRKIVAAGQSTSWPRWDATGMRLELLLLTMRPCLDNCKRNIPHTPSLPFCLENIKSLEGAQEGPDRSLYLHLLLYLHLHRNPQSPGSHQ